jgi:predicted glycogen debranching enzyme
MPTETPALPQRRIAFDTSQASRPDLDREWLVTNGLGGYGSGPIAGGLSRRYHGLLVSSLPAPHGRTLYLPTLRVFAETRAREWVVDHEDPHRLLEPDAARLVAFRLDGGLPVWTYAASDLVIEKQVLMPHGENTVHVSFTVVEAGAPVRLMIWPVLQTRPHEGALTADPIAPPAITSDRDWTVVTPGAGLPPLRLGVRGGDASSELSAAEHVTLEYAVELARGYDHVGALWTPGWIEVTASAGRSVTVTATVETRDELLARAPADAMAREHARRESLLLAAGAPADPVVAELTLAADQFLIVPMGRAAEVARDRARGEDPRSVIAGYHWFTDWGRDTMISLEGLALDTGRFVEADHILRTFAHHVRDGLIPNMFPEGEHQGLYHTADATLWFFHAIDRYVARTGDHRLLDDLLPGLLGIVEKHLAGTHFGIRVDPADGLLTQGAEHYQLTWMDAKVGDWVVTPRRGKAVEINALWYNALRLMAGWLDAAGQEAPAELCRVSAARARESFNRRFWNAPAGHLYDVVDGEHGDDPACRPNQIFAISLPHPVLDQPHWAAVVDVVTRTLVTPVGLRSLAPGHPEYQPKYFGDLYARDAAYHQGTVWAWLIGPFIDAWRKVHPDDSNGARRWLQGFVAHLDEACVGSISEVFDAEPPFTPRVCIAQAWSVAEVLRTWRLVHPGSPASPARHP